jgi:AraC-like DNA-binding protein
MDSMLSTDGLELPEQVVTDALTNTVLSDFPVHCVFRSHDIQQPFLHSHQGYEWYLCLGGSGRFIAGGRFYDVGAGTLIVVRPLALHMPRSEPGGSFHRYVLMIDKEYLDHIVHPAAGNTVRDSILRWLPGSGEDSAQWQLNARQLLSLQDTLAQLEREITEKRDGYPLYVHSLVLQLLAGLGRHETEPVPVQQANGDRRRLVEEMMDYMAGRYRESFRMEELCRRFHLSRSYLHRIFKLETGVSVNEYLIAYRVNKAKELLQSGGLPLTEVAAASGFSDLSHFCHMFKRLTGVTPGRYRISHTAWTGHAALTDHNA